MILRPISGLAASPYTSDILKMGDKWLFPFHPTEVHPIFNQPFLAAWMLSHLPCAVGECPQEPGSIDLLSFPAFKPAETHPVAASLLEPLLRSLPARGFASTTMPAVQLQFHHHGHLKMKKGWSTIARWEEEKWLIY